MTPPSKGLAEFVAEATESLETLGAAVMGLDARRGHEPDPDIINAVFRAAHSLKGLSAMFGQERIAQLAHRAEDLLDRLRLGKVQLTDEVINSLVEMVDVLQALVAETARGETTEDCTARADRLALRLGSWSDQGGGSEADPLEGVAIDSSTRAVLTEYEEHRLRENVRKGLTLWRVRAVFELSSFDEGLADLTARIKPLGEVISTLPSSEPSGDSRIAFDLILGSRTEGKQLVEVVSGMPVSVELIAVRAKDATPPAKTRGRRKKVAPLTPAPLPEPTLLKPPLPGPRELDPSLRSLTQTVRVDIRKLDTLMNAVGELLLIKGNLQRLADNLRAGGAIAVSKLVGQELHRETRQLERKLDDVQKGLLEARMVPLQQLFEKLTRLVRRIAREAGKEIDFRVSGGDVELDKLIVEELSDPLMHIIRNSIDHGVEAPQARERLGKPRRGTVTVWAAQRGNLVVIDVSDDGSGIKTGRVREVALQRGLISASEAQGMTERDLQSLIFLPGFSTARSVSELSGRGVGLDVVKTNIANLSGLIDVESDPRSGATFSITLPVTLAIIRALVVSVSGRLYAIPLNSVLEIVSLRPDELRTVERREVLSLRGHTVPFARLARLFNHPERPVLRHFVVVVGLAQDRLGLGVDELFGQQDIVIKPLGGRLRGIRGVAGATDLGNRRTVLVLDVATLMEEVINPERHAEFL